MLAVNDDCCREKLCLMADTSISGARVARELDALVRVYGKPASMRADHMPLGDNDQTFGVDAQAYRPVRKAGGHGIAVAIESDQAGGRYALSLFDKAIKHRGQWH